VGRREGFVHTLSIAFAISVPEPVVTVGWISLSLLLVYLFSVYAIYRHGH
jgi:hypothetical protein